MRSHERTVEGARPGSILLLHDGDGYDPDGDRMQTARAVPLIVDRLHGARVTASTSSTPHEESRLADRFASP